MPQLATNQCKPRQGDEITVTLGFSAAELRQRDSVEIFYDKSRLELIATRDAPLERHYHFICRRPGPCRIEAARIVAGYVKDPVYLHLAIAAANQPTAPSPAGQQPYYPAW